MSMQARPWDALADAESGNFASSFRLGTLVRWDQVVLEDGWLYYERAGWPSEVTVPNRLLETFILADTDEKRLSLAKKLGPLFSTGQGPLQCREKVEDWVDLQWQLSYLMQLAVALRDGSKIEDDPIDEFLKKGHTIPRRTERTMGEWLGHPPLPWSKSAQGIRRDDVSFCLSDRMRALVMKAELRPELVQRRRHFDIVFESGRPGTGARMIGPLVSQTLAAIVGTAIAQCSACGSIFVPRGRQPAAGRNRYCAKCGRPAAMRAARTRYRAKQRHVRLSKSNGTQ